MATSEINNVIASLKSEKLTVLASLHHDAHPKSLHYLFRTVICLSLLLDSLLLMWWTQHCVKRTSSLYFTDS